MSRIKERIEALRGNVQAAIACLRGHSVIHHWTIRTDRPRQPDDSTATLDSGWSVAERDPMEVLASRYGHPRYLTEDEKRATIDEVAREMRPPPSDKARSDG